MRVAGLQGDALGHGQRHAPRIAGSFQHDLDAVRIAGPVKVAVLPADAVRVHFLVAVLKNPSKYFGIDPET